MLTALCWTWSDPQRGGESFQRRSGGEGGPASGNGEERGPTRVEHDAGSEAKTWYLVLTLDYAYDGAAPTRHGVAHALANKATAPGPKHGRERA